MGQYTVKPLFCLKYERPWKFVTNINMFKLLLIYWLVLSFFKIITFVFLGGNSSYRLWVASSEIISHNFMSLALIILANTYSSSNRCITITICMFEEFVETVQIFFCEIVPQTSILYRIREKTRESTKDSAYLILRVTIIFTNL